LQYCNKEAGQSYKIDDRIKIKIFYGKIYVGGCQMQVLVLEASTSSAKAMVYDNEKGVIAHTTVPYSSEISDTRTHDIEGVYKSLITAGMEIAKGQDISAIAVGGTWHSVLLCDGSLKPLTRTYTWAYIDASDTAGRIRKDDKAVHDYYKRTGCMVHAIYPSFKLLYFKEKGENLRDKKIIGEGSYIFYRLTGEYKVSRSMASGSGLLNTHTLDWDEQVLSMLDIKRQQLPELCSYEPSGVLLEEAAEALGIRAGVPVVAAHPDGALNQVGAGALVPGIMTLSVGTSAAIRMAFNKPVLHDKNGTWCYYAPGRWLCGSATSGSTNCLDWFVKEVCQDKLSFKELENQMENAIGEPPVFLPFLYGERCPGWHDDRLGGFLDVKGGHEIGHLYRAILEGILFNLYHCYEILTKVGGEPKVIRASGGILKSKPWTQMLADILQRDIECSDMEQASMLGAAALALYACKSIDNIDHFTVEKGKIVSPDRSKGDQYKERYKKYLYWYEHTL